jgi:formate dehydrogenase subunit beta
MSAGRFIQVRGTRLVESFQDFLADWWAHIELEALLAPILQADRLTYAPQVIRDPKNLAEVNPFAPVFVSNAAALVHDLVRGHNGGKLAALLRPCELRTFIERKKRERAGGDGDVITISLACPGAFPLREYLPLAAEHGPGWLSQAIFTLPPPPADQLRTACRCCDRPEPSGADLMIKAICSNGRHYFLIEPRDKATGIALRLWEVTDGAASPAHLDASRVSAAHLSGRMPPPSNGASTNGGLVDLLSCVARCSLCADCLDACPLYGGELAGLLGVGNLLQSERPLLSELVAVSRWLASCTRCGMCEEACERGVPLFRIVSTISRRLQANLGYQVGDPAQKLPWMS